MVGAGTTASRGRSAVHGGTGRLGGGRPEEPPGGEQLTGRRGESPERPSRARAQIARRVFVTTNCQTEPLSQDFLKILAPKFGHFRFESGHHGNLWLHVDQPFLRPSRLHPFVIELAKGFSRHGVEGVCGPFVEGAFLAQMVASALEVEFYYSERFVALERDALYPVDYRLPSGLRRAAQGKRVAIVDDVINAGSAVRATYA